MWVVRDKDKRLKLFVNKPDRRDDLGFWHIEESKSVGYNYPVFGAFIDNKLFPDLKWEDEPIEITIDSIENVKRSISYIQEESSKYFMRCVELYTQIGNLKSEIESLKKHRKNLCRKITSLCDKKSKIYVGNKNN